MYVFCFSLLLFCNFVRGEDCVTENFENGTDAFTNCNNNLRMVLAEYSAFNLISPHPRSTKFIMPQAQTNAWPCLRSPIFTVTRGGILEVNRYTTSKNNSDFLHVDVVMVNGNNLSKVIRGTISPSQEYFVPGWETFRIIVPGSGGTFKGLIRIQGRDPGSIMLIDSYRFISPTYNRDLCKIYEDETTSTTTTTKEPQTTTTRRVTESSTTRTAATPTAGPSTSTQAPRLSISLQNKVKEFKLSIKKFFK